MKAKLPELKRELESLPQPELVRLCLRIAKHKTENKELLDYLLWSANDPLLYAQEFKLEILLPFEMPFVNAYNFTKSIRKSLRLISKYLRFTGSRQGECELLLALVESYHTYYRREFRTAALSKIMFRCLKKAATNISKLHEDIQADYTSNYNDLLRQTITRLGTEYALDQSYI